MPQREFLPEGVPNFVTLTGMDQSLSEKQKLVMEREDQDIANESEKRIAVNFINAKLQLLNDRIAETRVVDPRGEPQDEIRLGALFTLKNEGPGKFRLFRWLVLMRPTLLKGRYRSYNH